jgi:hypothetical protein
LGYDRIVVQRYGGAEVDDDLVTTAWHRIAWRDPHLVFAHFQFVVTAAAAELPEIVAVRDAIAREARHAVIWTPRSDRDD